MLCVDILQAGALSSVEYRAECIEQHGPLTASNTPTHPAARKMKVCPGKRCWGGGETGACRVGVYGFAGVRMCTLSLSVVSMQHLGL